MVIGGAIGNLVDRLVHGFVVDFLHFYYQDWHYPAFNVADIAIVCGAGLLLFDAFKGEGANGSQEKKA
jgi:signal peptidase II